MIRPVKVPHGFIEVKQVFGDVMKYILADGTLDPAWEEQNICRVRLPEAIKFEGTTVKMVAVHKLLYDLIDEVFNDLHERGLWGKLHEYGGGFCFRKQRGANVTSLHSWGIAIDLNPGENQLGTRGSMDHDVVMAFQSRGFEWGGDFLHRKDPMHFQYATGC